MAQDRKNGNSDKSMTAVEWLVQELTVVYPRIEEMKLLTDKARHMEKEQITTAYQADRRPCSDKDAEQYYNETFGNK